MLLFHCKADPMMTYQPGDSFDVFCPNRATEVEDMLHRLGLHDKRNHRVNISLRKDTKKKGKVRLSNHFNMQDSHVCDILIYPVSSLVIGAQLPPHTPEHISLLYLLTWCLEIRSVPKKVLYVHTLLYSYLLCKLHWPSHFVM